MKNDSRNEDALSGPLSLHSGSGRKTQRGVGKSDVARRTRHSCKHEYASYRISGHSLKGASPAPPPKAHLASLSLQMPLRLSLKSFISSKK